MNAPGSPDNSEVYSRFLLIIRERHAKLSSPAAPGRKVEDMDKLNRYLEKPVFQDLEHKMVFLGGPRQVGKTTMAKMVASRFGTSSYLNWDSLGHRKAILAGLRPPDCE